MAGYQDYIPFECLIDGLIALIHQWIDLFIGNNADETNNKGFLSTLIHTKGKNLNLCLQCYKKTCVSMNLKLQHPPPPIIAFKYYTQPLHLWSNALPENIFFLQNGEK